MKKRIWNIPDLLDLEFFLHRDQELSQKSGDAQLVERDRELYQQELARGASIQRMSRRLSGTGCRL